MCRILRAFTFAHDVVVVDVVHPARADLEARHDDLVPVLHVVQLHGDDVEVVPIGVVPGQEPFAVGELALRHVEAAGLQSGDVLNPVEKFVKRRFREALDRQCRALDQLLERLAVHVDDFGFIVHSCFLLTLLLYAAKPEVFAHAGSKHMPTIAPVYLVVYHASIILIV